MPKHKLSPLKLAHKNLRKSLREWMLAKKRFEDESAWRKDHLSPYEIHRRIKQSADHIEAYVIYVKGLARKKSDWVTFLIDNAYKHIRDYPMEMARAVRVGTDVLLDHCEYRDVFLSWKAICASVDLFARSAAEELNALRSKYPDFPEEALLGVVRPLEYLSNAAIECRDRGIKGYSKGPLCEYASEDAKTSSD